jgi:hypothetical protein
MPRHFRLSSHSAAQHPLVAAAETPLSLLIGMIYLGLAVFLTVELAGTTAAFEAAVPALIQDCNP